MDGLDISKLRTVSEEEAASAVRKFLSRHSNRFAASDGRPSLPEETYGHLTTFLATTEVGPLVTGASTKASTAK